MTKYLDSKIKRSNLQSKIKEIGQWDVKVDIELMKGSSTFSRESGKISVGEKQYYSHKSTKLSHHRSCSILLTLQISLTLSGQTNSLT